MENLMKGMQFPELTGVLFKFDDKQFVSSGYDAAATPELNSEIKVNRGADKDVYAMPKQDRLILKNRILLMPLRKILGGGLNAKNMMRIYASLQLLSKHHKE